MHLVWYCIPSWKYGCSGIRLGRLATDMEELFVGILSWKLGDQWCKLKLPATDIFTHKGSTLCCIKLRGQQYTSEAATQLAFFIGPLYIYKECLLGRHWNIHLYRKHSVWCCIQSIWTFGGQWYTSGAASHWHIHRSRRMLCEHKLCDMRYLLEPTRIWPMHLYWKHIVWYTKLKVRRSVVYVWLLRTDTRTCSGNTLCGAVYQSDS